MTSRSLIRHTVTGLLGAGVLIGICWLAAAVAVSVGIEVGQP